jgi:hypothetical protein
MSNGFSNRHKKFLVIALINRAVAPLNLADGRGKNKKKIVISNYSKRKEK